MVVADFCPVWPILFQVDRDIETLTDDEWGKVIVQLGGLRTAFEHAERQATEAWAQRFPRPLV